MSNGRNLSDEVLARYLAGNSTKAEIDEISEWLAESDEHVRELASYRQIWEVRRGPKAGFREVDTDGAWEKLKQGMERRSSSVSETKVMPLPVEKSRTNKPLLGAAAVVALAMLFGWFYMTQKRVTPEEPQLISFSTANNTATKQLPDGSTVSLNYNSSLEYPEHFDGDIRKVKLTGEAFFDVTRNPAMPFVIEANGASIKVLGTSFNVKAYQQQVRVDVKTGKVEVSRKSNQILLEKGQSAEVVSDSLIRPLGFDGNRLGYLTGDYEFRAESLGEVVATLNEGYHVQIRLGSAALANCRYTGGFSNEPLESLLGILTESLNLSYSKKGNVFVISGVGCN